MSYLAAGKIMDSLQVVGVIAATTGLSAYAYKSQRALKIQMGAASQVWAIYFLGLDLMTACLVQVLIGLRTWVSIYIAGKEQYKSKYLTIVTVAFAFAMLITWDGWVSLLPTLAGVNSTYAYTLSNLKMRFMFLLSSCLSMIFAILIQSKLLIGLELLGIVINLFGLFKILYVGSKPVN